MRVKPGVDFDGAQPELLRGLSIADEVYRKHTGADVIVTSVMRHGQGDMLHRVGLAADLAVRDLAYCPLPGPVVEAILEDLRWALGKSHGGTFDVVDERKVATGPHLHLEHDPAPKRVA